MTERAPEPEPPASLTSAAASTASATAATTASRIAGAFQLGEAASCVRAAVPQRRHQSCAGPSEPPHSGHTSPAGVDAATLAPSDSGDWADAPAVTYHPSAGARPRWVPPRRRDPPEPAGPGRGWNPPPARLLVMALGRQVRALLGSQVRALLGSQVRAPQGSQVRALLGSQVRARPVA